MKTKKPAAKKPKEIVKLFLSSMKKIAKQLDKPAEDITAAQFWANDPNDIPEWEVRRVGGFKNLKDLYFPKSEEDLVVKKTAELVSSHRKKIENQLGTRAMLNKEFAESFQETVSKIDFKIHKPVKDTKIIKKPSARTLVAHMSDTHFGCNVDSAEMGGLNRYDWTIASRRAALFAEQIVKYKPHYRKETDLVLVINGDIIAGMIHNQEWFVDLLTTQFAGTLSILTQMISYLAQNFRNVKVVFQPGNHGRSMHKASTERGTTHKWDSYETQIYIAIREVCKAKLPNVTVDIPVSPFAIFEAQGHNFFVTHGDTVINVGNPGKAINIGSINNQVNKLNASHLGGNKKFAGVIIGHVHTPTLQLMESGCMLIINGCLSGLDPYANSIGIFDSNPTQQIFEVTEKHAVGDVRFIQVKDADNNTALDNIIEPFKGLF
jgi:UDP-2,3-diacylglucosamine pyrophosphatase LpxH